MMSSGKKFHRRATNKSKGDHNPAQCNHTLHGKYIHYKPDKATEGKDVITIYDNDGDRELIVPNPDPIDIPGILPMSEFQRLKKQAHVRKPTKLIVDVVDNIRQRMEGSPHKSIAKLSQQTGINYESKNRNDGERPRGTRKITRGKSEAQGSVDESSTTSSDQTRLETWKGTFYKYIPIVNRVPKILDLQPIIQYRVKSKTIFFYFLLFATGLWLKKVEDDACEKNLYLLQRAYELRQEQEEEVKNVNSLVLATKCMLIREAQIKEKEVSMHIIRLIRKELEEEEQRLDMMMEQSRQRAIKAEEEKQELQVNKTKSKKCRVRGIYFLYVRYRYVKQVIQQIKENNLQKLMEAERIEEESRMINKANLQMQKEDEERARKKKEEQRRMQEDMKLANENVKRYKRIRQEEERIADLRVKEFMRKKDAREGRREQEQEALKLAKEREIERLRMIQEKAQEQKANVDELNARRAAEEAERAWREKEKEAALKRKQQVIEMKRGREQQIDDMRRAQALEMARDEKECREACIYIYTYIYKYNVYTR
ncbi:nasopharyngeal epithelium specific protein 1 [Holotrichia oblita]|uniref:Nasopharyngeal epithelium specific protein 1 n=1 Tax=Holotrichia oblita TaxID=644536 RepID=A0ACB9TII5_HOLOL|nr:nasopharyngeal epithelium specific protein 1 [Holotrichia oblita]